MVSISATYFFLLLTFVLLLLSQPVALQSNPSINVEFIWFHMYFKVHVAKELDPAPLTLSDNFSLRSKYNVAIIFNHCVLHSTMRSGKSAFKFEKIVVLKKVLENTGSQFNLG